MGRQFSKTSEQSADFFNKGFTQHEHKKMESNLLLVGLKDFSGAEELDPVGLH